MAVNFFEQHVKAGLTNKSNLKKFLITQVLSDKQCALGVNYIFVSDEALLQMNIDYLQHNTYTDIITFNLSKNDKKIMGEVYISTERVEENAKKFKVEYLQELHRVIFHGALHLCGYNDKTPKQKKEMRAMEDLWLQKYYASINDI